MDYQENQNQIEENQIEEMPQPAAGRQGTRSLAVGAMCACLVVVLALLGRYAPILGRVFLFAIPLPIVIAVLQCGIARGIMSVAAASILTALFLGPTAAISVLVRYGMLGLAFGICFRQKYSGGKVFSIVTVVYMLSYVLGLLLSFGVAGIPVRQGITEMIAMVNSVFDTLENQSYLAAVLPPGMGMEEYITMLKKMTYAILPATFVTYSMLTVWLNYLIGVFVLGKMGYGVTPLPPFTRWQMPLPLVWLAIAGLVLGIAGNYLQQETLTMISGNLLYVLLCLFALGGLSLVCAYLAQPQIPMVIKTMTVLMLVFFAFFSIVVLGLFGVLDVLFDWRKLQKPLLRR